MALSYICDYIHLYQNIWYNLVSKPHMNASGSNYYELISTKYFEWRYFFKCMFVLKGFYQGVWMVKRNCNVRREIHAWDTPSNTWKMLVPQPHKGYMTKCLFYWSFYRRPIAQSHWSSLPLFARGAERISSAIEIVLLSLLIERVTIFNRGNYALMMRKTALRMSESAAFAGKLEWDVLVATEAHWAVDFC